MLEFSEIQGKLRILMNRLMLYIHTAYTFLQRVNLLNGHGLQIPFNLHFTGYVNFVNKLKDKCAVENPEILGFSVSEIQRNTYTQ